MDTKTDLPTPLRRAREARGLRLEDIAAASGVSLRTAFDAERERHRPHPSTRRALALALDMDPTDLWPPDRAA